MRYKTTISDWNALDTEDILDVSFSHLFANNIYYNLYEKL